MNMFFVALVDSLPRVWGRFLHAAVWGGAVLGGVTAQADCLGDAASPVVLKIAVVPQLPPAELYAHWAPLLEKLGNTGHWCFQLQLQRSIPDFEAEMLAGKPDLAFMNPYHQVMAHKRAGYRPLVADSTLLTGIVVVRKNSPVQKLEDLRDKTLAFPAPNSFAATLLPRALMAQKGIPIQVQFVKTHTNVYRSVQINDTAAGGGVNNTLKREPDVLQQELRVLYETPGFRAHPLSAHPRVPTAVQAALRQAFVALAEQAEGRVLLDKIQMPRPQAVDYAKDYLPLERLGLESFVDASK